MSNFKQFQESLRGLDPADAQKICDDLNRHMRNPEKTDWDSSRTTLTWLQDLRTKIVRIYWDDQDDNPLQVQCRKGWFHDHATGLHPK